MKIMHIVGARPNFVKVAPIMAAMAQGPTLFEQLLVHTGQHYDDAMSKVFFEDLALPPPDVYLGIGAGSHAQQTARIMSAIELTLVEHAPDWLMVVGDVNSTVACALTATKLGIKVAHIEAGLRSFDRTMPEEINRLVTDHIADLMFTTENSANANLRREGIDEQKIHFVGNVMIDTLVRLLPKTNAPWQRLRDMLNLSHYCLVTLHRPSNVDDPTTLREIMLALHDLTQDLPVVFPVHPRTQRRIAEYHLQSGGAMHLLPPLGYLDFLALTRHAALVITDSGGVQEETTFLGIPCLTVRPNTERPVTLTVGSNRLVASKRSAIVDAAHATLGNSRRGTLRLPELWDGRAAQRIVAVMHGLAQGAEVRQRVMA